MNIRRSRILLALVVLAAACGDDTTSPDGAMPDGAMADGVMPDGFMGPDVPMGPDTSAPDWADSMLVATEVQGTLVALAWDAAVDPSGIESYTLSRDGVVLTTTSDLTYRDAGVVAGETYFYKVEAEDPFANRTTDGPELSVMTIFVTPDPMTVAPTLDPASYPTFDDRVSFLWEGDPPVQTDVAEGAIEPRRVSVLRGRVIQGDGSSLGGVIVRALSQDGAGKTTTRADGRFDLAFNGGGLTTLTFEAEGYLDAQRSLTTYYNAFYEIEDVELVAPSAVTSPVDFGMATYQVAQSEAITDATGTRTPTVIIPGGTEAEAVLADGTRVPLGAVNIRITEYTVGDGEDGLRRMPGTLPRASAYTHAIELSVDEAEAMDAVQVTFDSPVYYYVENFVGFPVGENVPVGYYDAEQGLWIASDNGRVIEVVSIAGGVAEVDIDGDGIAESAADLLELGFTAEERTQLATLYSVGQSLWRAAIPHFSPWDLNWPVLVPSGAEPPDAQHWDPFSGDDPCKQNGSEIWCQDRALGERVRIPGTPHTLVYNSNRSGENTRQRTFDMLVMDTVPDEPPKRVEVTVSVLGRVSRRVLAPAPGLRYRYVWDGLDAYGNELYGQVHGVAEIRHVYDQLFSSAAVETAQRVFGATLGQPVDVDRQRGEVSFIQRIPFQLVQYPTDDSAGIGGWSLQEHHSQDPRSGAVFLGDGNVRPASPGVEHVAGVAGVQSSSGDGGLATEAGFSDVIGFDVAPDGSIYVLDDNARLRRIAPDGIITTVAGNGRRGFSGDGGPGTDAEIDVGEIAVGLQGEVYMTQRPGTHSPVGQVIRVLYPEGNIEYFAGLPTIPVVVNPVQENAGRRKEDAEFFGTRDLVVGPSGLIYVVAGSYNLGIVDVIHPDGHVEERITPGAQRFTADQRSGLVSDYGFVTAGLTIDDDGRLYIQGLWRRSFARLALVRVDGVNLEVLSGAVFEAPNSEPEFGQDMNLFRLFENSGRGGVPTPFGYMTPVSGGFLGVDQTNRVVAFHSGASPSPWGYSGDGGPLAFARFLQPISASTINGRDGSIYLDDQHATVIRRINLAPVAQRRVLSSDGTQLFVFGADGRHVETQDALHGTTLVSFRYAEGGLSETTDKAGRTTTFERAADGTLMAIVGADGSRTMVTHDASGNLASLNMPGGRNYAMGYAGSLLTSFENPDAQVTTFTYSGGALTSETVNGETATLGETGIDGGQRVTFVSRGARTTTYETTSLAGEGTVQTDITADGVGTLSLTRSRGGFQNVALPSGTTISVRPGHDPRPGVERDGQVDATTPAGLIRSEVFVSTVTPADPTDLRGPLAELTVTRSLNTDVTTSTWDAAAGTATRTDPAGFSTTLQYTDGVPTRVSRTGLDDLSLSYDAQGRPASYSWDTYSIGIAHDDALRTTSYTDANGGVFVQTHSDVGWPMSVTLPEGQLLAFARNGVGQLTQMTLPSGDLVSMTRHTTGALSSIMFPSGAEWDFARDADGEIELVTLPTARTTSTSRDASHRVITQTAPSAIRTYTYVGDTARYASATSTFGAETQSLSYGYDGDLVTSLVFAGSAGGSFALRYDNKFDLAGVALDGSPERVIGRDATGRRNGDGPYVFGLNGPGLSVSTAMSGAFTAGYTWNGSAQLTGKTFQVGGFSYAFTTDRDGVGNGLTLNESGAGTRTRSFAYDQNSRLTHETEASAESFTYDDNGNLLSRGAEAFTYNVDDHLMQAGAVTVAINADGQLASKGSDTFVYSAQGDLLSADVGGVTQTYVNDALHRRTATLGASTTEFLYGDTERPFRMTHARGPEGLTEYFYDPYGHVLGFIRGAVTYHVASDQVGSPRFVIDGAGTVIKELRYDAWGNTLLDSAPGFPLHVGFAGGLPDAHTGFVSFGVREYDPDLARFTTLDPALFAGRRANLFAYADNNPTSRVDPSGFFSLGVDGALGPVSGNAEFAASDGAMSICFGGGMGMGIGAGIGFNPLGQAAHDQTFIKNEASFEVMGFGIGGSNTLADINCGDGRILEDVVTNSLDTSIASDNQAVGFLRNFFEHGVELGAGVGIRTTAGECHRAQIW